MNDLIMVKSLLDEIDEQKIKYIAELLKSGPSLDYQFGFLEGEYNLKKQHFIKLIEMIKKRDKNFLKYISYAVHFCFQNQKMEHTKKIEKICNDYSCHQKQSDWNNGYKVLYEKQIETEKEEISKIQSVLKNKKIDFLYDYYKNQYISLNIENLLKNWIIDKEYYKENYCYFNVIKMVFDYYCFEKKDLEEFKPKDNSLYEYFSNKGKDLLLEKDYVRYGLIPLNSEYEPICTKNLECRLYNKDLNITISLTPKMDNILFEIFIDLKTKGVIKDISFRPSYNVPNKGKDCSDIAMEAIEFGKQYDVDFNNLIPTKLTSENMDTLWIYPDLEEKSITFEELVYDFDTFDDCIVTQVIHLLYHNIGNTYYINHIDHEYIFYNFKEYEERMNKFSTKGQAQKRKKTFKILNSNIPFLTNGKPEFLIKVLYTYFNRKDLLDEYFSKYR